MRLFIAILLDQEIKDGLCGAIDRLQQNSTQGNFTHRENLHLTLAFLGETARLGEIKRAMDGVTAEPFPLSLGGFGKFRRDGGDIYWVGVNRNNALTEVYNQLWVQLSAVGFTPEARAFKPHLTLGREVRITSGFQESAFEKSMPKMDMTVKKLSLMKSERIQGRLTYTEIYAKQL